VDLNAGARGFACCEGQRAGIGIESDDGDAWMKLLDVHGQRAGAATDVEDALTGRKLQPVNHRSVKSASAQQLGARVIDGQGPVPTRCGEKGPFRSHDPPIVAGGRTALR
jgi:hypothetical protein